MTSIVTNADGSHSTMLSASASAVPSTQDDSSGPSGKTWGIIGGVVGVRFTLIPPFEGRETNAELSRDIFLRYRVLRF